MKARKYTNGTKSVTNLIKFKSSGADFYTRMKEQETITPVRFVWHVAVCRDHRNHDLERFSIATEGLIYDFSNFKVIFANNALYSITEFYPFFFEFCIWPESTDPLMNLIRKELEEPLLLSDFWRIDTHAFNAEWRIDPNMKAESRVKIEQNYLCTPMNIPPYALRMYKVIPAILRAKIEENRKTGSTVFPLSMLKADERVNNWIKRNVNAA
jgi:hypothetical protein